MSSRYSKDLLRNVNLAVWYLCAVLVQRADAATVLNVCIDRANPTMGTDSRVVHAAAKTQEYAVKLVPFVGYGKGGEGFPISRFAKMAQSECELIMGFPVDISNPHLPPNVEATAPYASTSFVLVSRNSSRSASLSKLPTGSIVGIAQLDTYAGLLYSIHPNIVMHVYPENADMLADLEAQHIVAGLAWEPSILRYQKAQPKQQALSVRRVPGEHMLWNLVALYAPESRSAAIVFDKGLDQLRSSGRLDSLIKPFQRAAPAQSSAPLSAPHPQPAIYRRSAAHIPFDGSRLVDLADVTRNTSNKHGRIPPALYTEKQAAAGAIAYHQNCATCHGPLLDGQSGGYSGPALRGLDFADPSFDFHVNDIFNVVARLMPAANPGSLPPDVYVVIMAFLLKQNGYPAGTQELTYEAAAKSPAPMLYYGK